MKQKIILLCLCLVCTGLSTYAQWVVSDPTNLAQGIVNSTKQVVEAAKNGSTMLQSFQERYYDALKSVSNLVRSARKVQQCILLVGEISDIYVDGYRRMVGDENFTPAELAAIAAGYARIIEESAGELKELQDIVNPTDMSLTDKDRIDVVQRVYGVLRRHRDLARYYTRKNISISLLRAARKRDMEGVLSLYGTDEQRYW
ncbi:MAG: conjugal transfer protein [Alistipes sp. 58_9_plus]|nr:MAG: conjugal transfer protein [Alistipes sp. 58_9_plus]